MEEHVDNQIFMSEHDPRLFMDYVATELACIVDFDCCD
jgi:hypothetical protein